MAMHDSEINLRSGAVSLEWDIALFPYTLRKNSSPHCINHLSHHSVDMQLGDLIKFREDSGVQM